MTEIEKEETKNTFEIANIIKQSNISLGDTPVYAIADLLSNASYRKEKEVVKQFAEKVNEVIEACEMQDGYDAEGSPIYTIDTAILRVEMEQIAEQYGKEEDTI